MHGACFLCFLLLLPAGLLLAGTVPPPTDCDTLLTKDGRTLIVTILRSNTAEVQYYLCGTPDDVRYALKTEQILSIRPEKKPTTQIKPLPGVRAPAVQRRGGYSLRAGMAMEMLTTGQVQPELSYLLVGEYALIPPPAAR